MKKTIALAYLLENFSFLATHLQDAFRELQESNGIFISKANPEELEKVKFFFNRFSHRNGAFEEFLLDNYRLVEQYVGLALLAYRKQQHGLVEYIIIRLLKQKSLAVCLLSSFSIFSKPMEACGIQLITNRLLKNENCQNGGCWER